MEGKGITEVDYDESEVWQWWRVYNSVTSKKGVS
jgi:hypothetical protein